MSDCVWIGDLHKPSSDAPSFEYVFKGREPPELSGTEYRMRYVLGGEPLVAEHFPDQAYLDLDPETETWPAKRYPSIQWSSKTASSVGVRIVALPEFAHVGRSVVVSQPCLDTLRGFDLGETRFHPLELFQSDHATPILGRWHAMTFPNRKQCFFPDASEKLIPQGRGLWMPLPTFADDDLAVTREALVGAEVWADPALRDYVFLSDRLHTALADRGMLGGIKKVARVRIL